MTTDHDSPPSARALRTMAIVRWVLLALVSGVAFFSVWVYWGPGRAPAQTLMEDKFMCAMHPQIRSPEPGQCPICGMDLVPIPPDRKGDPAAGAPKETPKAEVGPPVVGLKLTLERQQLVGITTAPARLETITPKLRLAASVELPDDAVAQLHTRVSGFLEKVEVRQRGVAVEAGQTLAWIYSPQLLQAQEELLTTARWGKNSELAAAARRSVELLGMAPGDVDALLRDGTAQRLIAIRAPAAGTVTALDAVLGAYVTPEAALYTIVDRSRVWVVAHAAERDLASLHAGLAASFVPGDSARQPLAATIELIEPTLDPETRTAGVRLVVANQDQHLVPGMFGEVTVALTSSQSVVVPRDAVIDTGRWQYVFVAFGGGEFEPRVVTLGRLLDAEREIVRGLSGGELVVVRGGFMLDSESRLQAALGTAPAGASPMPPGMDMGTPPEEPK
ncbi:MAG: efflux RND transporter periplasmic adaptor subunit [Myxococcota bacterium]